MSLNNKDIGALIVDFLSTIIEKNEVSEDNADSLNVAMDCISEALEFDREVVPETIKNKFNGKTLVDILNTTSTATANTTIEKEESVEVNIPVEDAEIKANAEAFKLEGNKAMAMKDFHLAVEKYTEAIKILPTNAIYYANRAAAHSSLKEFEEAIKDAESAIKIDPSYSKGYSRLAFAKYGLGKHEEALESYKKVLDIEGDNATAGMKRDYETAKKRVEESMNVEKSKTPEQGQGQQQTNESAQGNAPNPFAGGMPDMSSLFGGAGMGGGLGSLLSNPDFMSTAQKLMSDPNAMQQVQSMMSDPSMRDLANNFKNGNTDMNDIMNNPAIRNMASNLFKGNPSEENQDKQ
ncbi:Sgt2p NDAI_0D00810 [Naumovozyma dairenensis CBS 421]|uniref:SGTA homodimerisation domain-containing protein n=1 Tax=Naumovozyma dairenensis (strain ATCC 10597 / BCRC 20456 / CBS 421 / NBRC 0211 / NRRL Y-12639) TaxID=1071378 RepID=G0W9D4_NAUDC|nr:hypothetical protein NDAI_0D00810 [Naumovozyma dairenensis CBS 421]CCD24395.1 hypothetical protein NDAI_0D00810 [Naumovozyma dairenensis CBS 421]